MKEKRILFLAHDALAYGGNQSLVNIISFLESNNIYSTVLFPRYGLICDIFDDNGWNYHIVNYRNELCPKNTGIRSSFKIFLSFCYKSYLNKIASTRIISIIKKERINIIHSNSSVLSLGFSIAKKLSICHTWHLREFIHPNYGLYVFGGLARYRKKIKAEKNILCVSHKVAKEFNVELTSTVLYDAIRKKAKFSVPQIKKDYFLYCGSIHKNKGVEDAIFAMNHVSKSYPNFKLLIVGEGSKDYEEELKIIVSAMGLQDTVLFLGFRTDIDELMANSAAFLMCSRNEALGRVTIESMLNFCLVLGYNDGGTSEIIEDNKTGLLYNDLETLISLMQKVINQPGLFNNILINAYNYANSNFLEKNYGLKLLMYYDRLK